MPPTNPKRSPPMVTTCAVEHAHAGPGELRPERRHVDVARVAYVGVGIAANSAAYCSRTASSIDRGGIVEPRPQPHG